MKKLWEKYREIIVYIIVGLLTTMVSYGVRLAILYPVSFALSLDLASQEPAMVAQVSLLRTVAQSLGWVAGVVFAFIPNKKWVFRNEEGGKTLWAQFGKFVASRVGTYFVELGLAVLVPMLIIACGYQPFTFIITVDADLIATAISIVVVTVLNYILSKLLVFKDKKN
jgi:putative flippase GtrA